MSVLADRASGAGVLDRLQVLRSAPTPLRGAPAATWPPSPRTGVRQLRVAGPGLQPWLQDTTTTRTDPAGSTLATPVLGPRNGVHLRPTTEKLPFVKRYPFKDEREFRIIYEHNEPMLEAKDVPFEPSALSRVTINPWMPQAVFDSVRAQLLEIDGWPHVTVRRTGLVDNEQWKQFADGAEAPSSNARRPTSRTRGKGRAKPGSRAARG